MSSIVDKKLRFKAVDNVSGVVDRLSSKFPKLTKNAIKSQRAFERVQKSSAKMRQNLSRVGNGMKSTGLAMTMGLTLPIAAFGASAFKTAATFDKSMNKVQALTGASEKSLKSMREEAKRLGSTTAFSASQAGDAMAFFGQAGFNTNEILKATGPTLALAAASSTDLATTADIASNIMGGFNIKASEMGRVADVLALATAKGNINLSMMGETFKDAAPVALKYGSSLEEVSALTAKLGDAGIQGSKAGTTLKNMFLKITAAGPRAQKILKALGVQAIDPATGKMRKMTDILVMMNKGFKSKNVGEAKKLAILNEIFGKRAIAGAGVLLNAVQQMDPATGKVTNAVADLEKKLKGSTGAAKEMQKTMQKGLPGAIASVKSAFEGFQIAFMDSGIKEFIADIINGIAKFFRWMSKLNPTLLKWGGIIAAVVAVMGPLVLIMGTIIAALPMLITGFEALAVIFPIMQAGLAPTLLLFAKFALVAGAIAFVAFSIIKNWEPIKNFFADLFTSPIQQIKDMIFWLGKISGISSLLGIGDDTDEKLKAQGFKFQGEPAGDPTKSEELTKKNSEFLLRKQQASVDVKFSNMPKDTRVMSEDRESILNIDTGLMGAI